MNETATLDVARENADAVSHLIEQYVHQNGHPKDVPDIIRFARLLWLIVRDVWEQFQADLDHGLEAGRARQAAASAALACDSLLRVMNQLEETAQAGARDRVEAFAELRAAAAKAEQIQREANSLIVFLSAPKSPIDEARLAEGLAAGERGNFEDTTTIIERLRAGGEL